MSILDSFFYKYEDKRNSDRVESMLAKAFVTESNYAKVTTLMKVFEKKATSEDGIRNIYLLDYFDRDDTDDDDYYINRYFLLKIPRDGFSFLKKLTSLFFRAYDKNNVRINKKEQGEEKVVFSVSMEPVSHQTYYIYLNLYKKEGGIECEIFVKGYNTLDFYDEKRIEYPVIRLFITEEEYKEVEKEVRKAENKVLSAFGLG